MRNNGSRRGTSKKERDYIEYDGGRMTRNGLSANHLLNFQLPEREKTHAHGGRKKKAAGPVRTQMEYLHANYRFVIAPLADEGDAVACWDVETLTEWNAVEQVLLWYDESSPATCPICLDAFRAPKITRCGHIFCWPCILRYLSMTDKYWRRCPMCFDSVQKGQLRSVRLESVQLPPRVDADATFQFLQRAKASLFPHVRDPHASLTAPRKRVRKLPTVYDEEAKYARILESTHEYLLQLATGEMRDLEVLDAECRSSGDVDTLPFVEEAMKATSQRLAAIEANHAAATASGAAVDERKFQSLEGLAPSDLYSFYQQQNGCYVVLHPLNMKCLTREFAETAAVRKASMDAGAADAASASAVTPLEDAWAGASSPPGSARFEPSSVLQYERLPETIKGRVLEVEHLVMDEAVQKRYRFLGHLPKFCDFYVCELDLSELLSPATLEAFRPEIKKREKQRRAKKETEKRTRAKQASNATSPRSPPLYSEYAMRGFSLDDGEAHWPAPSEMSLSDAFHDGLQLGETDEPGARSAAPPTFSLADYLPASSDASFATITRNSGYYPPLGGAYYPPLGGASASGDRDVTSSPSMWGAATGPLSFGGASSPPMAGRGAGGKKKGAMKKGTQLFSTSQRRSYR